MTGPLLPPEPDELQTGEWNRELVAEKAATVRLADESEEPVAPYEEEMSPFTGTLPQIQPAAQPNFVQQDIVEEEMNPFTGNLPQIQQQVSAAQPGRVWQSSSTGNRSANPDWLNDRGNAPAGQPPFAPKVVDSQFVPVPQPVHGGQSGSLWSYAQNPVVPGAPAGQSSQAPGGQQGAANGKRSTRGLLSYSKKYPISSE
jgi:hypothetical protein